MPFEGRQGVDRAIAGWVVAIALAVDVIALAWRGRVLGLAPIDEVRMVPHARNTSAIRPPSWALLVVRRGPTGASLRARTVLVGVPEPVDVGTVLDGTDAR